MGLKLSTADNAHLAKLHPDLAKVVRRAAAIWPYKGQAVFITCSLRTVAEQKKLIAAGASQTMRSRHLPGAKTKLSHAVDFAIKLNGKLRWDWPLFVQLSVVMKQAAKDVGVPVEWGGDWRSFKDGPHFQLPWTKYPG
jgi:peptidoglycan L-alanyl-D-glutamate endopeptidase CwlK